MTPKQRERLTGLLDELLDVAAVELDPRNWPGYGLRPMDMSKDERGDRFWCKKDAAATLTLINKVDSITSAHVFVSEDDEAEMARQVQAAQKQADEILERMLSNAV